MQLHASNRMHRKHRVCTPKMHRNYTPNPTPTHTREKSFEFSGLVLASAGHVRERLTPARSDRDQRAAAHTCLLSGAAPMPLRMSALVHSSRCTKSSRSRSRGGIEHHLNNFLSGRTDPSCKLARLRGRSSEERSYRTSLVPPCPLGGESMTAPRSQVSRCAGGASCSATTSSLQRHAR